MTKKIFIICTDWCLYFLENFFVYLLKINNISTIKNIKNLLYSGMVIENFEIYKDSLYYIYTFLIFVFDILAFRLCCSLINLINYSLENYK